MGHPQNATPLQTDNACAAGIVNDTVKQRHSKAMDMRFYWIEDRVANGEYNIHWRKGTDNLADYFTKHHSPAHHRLMRSRYLLELHKTSTDSTFHQPVSGKGVLISLSGLPRDLTSPTPGLKIFKIQKRPMTATTSIFYRERLTATTE
jgi:hypothetical protein